MEELDVTKGSWLNFHLLVLLSITGIISCSGCQNNRVNGSGVAQSIVANTQDPTPPDGCSPIVPPPNKATEFPAKFPIKRYSNAFAVMVDIKADRPPGQRNCVLLRSPDPIKMINRFYLHKMVEERWKKIDEIQNEIFASTKWEKEGIQSEVRIAQDLSEPNGKRVIQLLYWLKPKKTAEVKVSS